MVDIAEEPKSAAWKINGARTLRAEGNAPYAWIAEALNMGTRHLFGRISVTRFNN